MKRLFSKFEDFEPKLRFEGEESVDVLLISYGSSYRLAKSAVKLLESNGISTGVLKLESLFPFPEKEVREITRDVQLVVVPEMNKGQIVREVERVCCCKVKSISYFGSLILPEQLARIVEEVL
jgi:2-oxoglutarate ferredoxin oxidoreductase subunit alpha